MSSFLQNERMAAAEKSWLSEKHVKYDPAKRTLLTTEVEEGGSYTEVMERAIYETYIECSLRNIQVEPSAQRINGGERSCLKIRNRSAAFR
jgi:hypothetical protein